MAKPNHKLKLTNQQVEIFEVVASNANRKYFFFPKVYIKLDTPNEFEEVDITDIPEGIRKYIENFK